MTTALDFEHCAGPGYPGEIAGYPAVVAHLSLNQTRRRYEMYLDTGASFTVLPCVKLKPFGFNPPSLVQIKKWTRMDQLELNGCKDFTAASGTSLIGYGIDLNLSIEGGPQLVDMTVYGIVEGFISRPLIGRDFFRRYVTAFDLYQERTYFHPS